MCSSNDSATRPLPERSSGRVVDPPTKALDQLARGVGPAWAESLQGWRAIATIKEPVVTEAAIVVEGVSKSFGDVHALVDVDLTIEEGKVFGLLGPNGAGKTTLVRILTTLLRPDRGSATVMGLDTVRDAVALRSRIGLAGQFAAVDEALTGYENVEMVGRLYNLASKEAKRRARDVLERIDLADAADRPVNTYSGGMRRRLDLAVVNASPHQPVQEYSSYGGSPRAWPAPPCRRALSCSPSVIYRGWGATVRGSFLPQGGGSGSAVFILPHGGRWPEAATLRVA